MDGEGVAPREGPGRCQGHGGNHWSPVIAIPCPSALCYSHGFISPGHQVQFYRKFALHDRFLGTISFSVNLTLNMAPGEGSRSLISSPTPEEHAGSGRGLCPALLGIRVLSGLYRL